MGRLPALSRPNFPVTSGSSGPCPINFSTLPLSERSLSLGQLFQGCTVPLVTYFPTETAGISLVATF